MRDADSRQQALVVAHDGSALVTACPGAGKTRVLTRRIARELSDNREDRRLVLAVTYTNRASDEIRARLDEMGVEGGRLWAGTIHAFCLEWILRPYAGYSDRLRMGFTIIDERRSLEIIESIKNERRTDPYLKVDVRLRVDGASANTDRVAAEVSDAYHAVLRRERLLDFDLILTEASGMVASFSEISTVLGSIFRLVCVDEYQDTHALQYGILAAVVRAAPTGCDLFMVGDPDQAIYSSLGGIAKRPAELRDEFQLPQLKELTLSGNYRSTQRIVDYFGRFRAEPMDSVALSPYAAEQGEIVFSNGQIQVASIPDVIARIVRARLGAGCPEHEIAVVAPQWQVVTGVARKLTSLLPKVSFDAPGLSPFRGCYDNVWYRVARLMLSTPTPAMFSTRVRWARELLAELGCLREIEEEAHRKAARVMLRLVNGADLSAGVDGLAALERAMVQLCGQLGVDVFGEPSLAAAYGEFFMTARKRLESDGAGLPNEIDAFRRAFGRGPGVVVESCHGVKGKEFDTVVAFGLLEGYVPHWDEIFADRSSAQALGNRLLYVVASRAKRHLYLIAESGRLTRKKRPYQTTPKLQALEFRYDACAHLA